MSIVFSRVTGSAIWNNTRVRLAQDDPWDADDPFVKAHPEHFTERPLRLFGYRGADVDVVEQATSNPGEKRTTRRAK